MERRDGRADEVRSRPWGFFKPCDENGGLSSVKEEVEEDALTSLEDRGTSAERVLDLFVDAD